MKKQDKPQGQYEEVEFVCAACGKKVKMLKTTGISTEGMLCQRCGLGEESLDDD
jgi:DNA-directed RNA polymerase subunit RPC12/RpoP